MRKAVISIFALLILTAASAGAQEVYFGKNKVRYKDFDWHYIQTPHFDIYFYERAYPTAKFTATVLESAYVEVSHELDYQINKAVPVFLYNSHNDFQQTNISPYLLPEGVGGFTEAFKNRIVIPFDGSYENLRHVLHHELTHAVTFDMLYGNMFSSLLSRQRLFNLPLWYAEGYAEYSSRHGWDYFSDMFVRDATINGYLTPPDYLGGFLAYKQGQAMVKYIADTYGEDKLGDILQKGKIHLTMDRAMKASVGISMEQFWKDFSKEMKRRYWPEIANRKEADEIGKRLTKSREDGSYFNERPAWSPDGDKIAIFSDQSDFTEIILISALDGHKIKTLVRSQRSGDLESLHSYVSGMSFSPEGRRLVFVAKSKGKESIFFYSLEDDKIYQKRRMDYYNIVSPAWSPDGKKVAFAALDGHKRDLFVYHIESDYVEQITDDRFDDVDPSWTQDSKSLVFTSDRPHPQNQVLDAQGHPYVGEGALMPGDFSYGRYNLCRADVETHRIEPVDVGPGPNHSAKVSPDGRKLAFISSRNGIDNIYIAYLDSVEHYAISDILTGVSSLAWSPEGDKLAYSAFFRGAYDIFTIDKLIPAGDNGTLEPTAYVRGEYNLIGKSKDKQLVVGAGQDSSVAAVLGETPEYATYSPDTVEAESPADTAEYVSRVDSTESDDGVIDSTGTYGDEYVYVSNTSTPLDSLFMDVESRDVGTGEGADTAGIRDEDIPDRLPSGEYEIRDYKVKLSPDYVSGGVSYNTFFGLRGQSYFIFSDYLGNHQIYLATDLVNTIDQSYIQAYYFNNVKRTNFGIGLFHTKNFYIDTDDFLFSDRFYGVQGVIRRPFSTYSRLELVGAQYFIDRKYYDFDDPREDRNSKVTTGTVSWVFDNVLWGYTGPINGRRAKLSITAGVNLFDASDIEFYSLEFDWRKYWHLDQQISMALRFAGGASEGRTPKQYFLGGTTNWIGSRTLDAKVYDVENLYFADVVTPLRGVPYYEMSGDRFALMNWELRFPLIQYFAMKFPLPIVFSNITGVMFTDVGSAWFDGHFKGATSQDGPTRLQDIHTGFGLGARLNVFGFLLLRYDLAWNTDFAKISNDPTSYFSFGADF